MKNLADVVARVINDWDPIELLVTHCPPDEYNMEISVVAALAARTSDAHELAEGIHQIFLHYFGPSAFQKDRAECLAIAEKILGR